MEACSFRAPNGKNSLLYTGLEQEVGDIKAAQIWREIQTDEFKEKHGDWSNQTPASANHPMKYKMPAGANRTGKDTSTIDLIEQGLRTASTRTKALGAVGDIITFEGRPQKYRITQVEKLTAQNTEDPAWIEQWSKKEQWTTEYFKTILGTKPTVRIGSFQTTFEKVDETVNKIPLDPNGEPTLEWVKSKIGIKVPTYIDISGSKKKSIYFDKDRQKFKMATALISRGSPSSSSAAYAEAAGDKTNPTNYSTEDVVAISAEGNRPGRIGPDLNEIQRAINAGVKGFITDKKTDRTRDYNVGEREVADFLEKAGYIEHNESGQWTKSQTKTETYTDVSTKVISLKDLTAGRDMSREIILERINKLYDEAAANPETVFQLDLPYNAIAWLKGKKKLTMYELAILLDSRAIPWNIKFSDQFQSIIENTPRRYLNNRMYEDNTQREKFEYTAKQFQDQLDSTFVSIRDANGEKTGGMFEEARQTEVVNSIMLRVYKMYSDDISKGTVGSVENYKNKIKDMFRTRMNGYTMRVNDDKDTPSWAWIDPAEAKALAKSYTDVLNSFDAKGLNFWDLTVERLNELGIRVKNKKLYNQNGKEIDEEAEAILEGDVAEGITDWSQSSFELDPKDTATARLKLFIASTIDSKVGDEVQPRKVNFSFNKEETRNKILSGYKEFTYRTAEQAKSLNLLKDEAVIDVNGVLFRIQPLRPATAEDVATHSKTFEEEEGVTAKGIPIEPFKEGDILYRMVRYTPRKNILTPGVNFLKLAKLADFEYLWSTMLGTLADGTPNFEQYIATLREAGNMYHPNLRVLADNLEKAPKELQNEFVSVVTKQYQEFTMLLLDSKKDNNGNPYYEINPVNANIGSQKGIIRNSWQQNQKFASILTRNQAGLTVVNVEKAKELMDSLNAVNAAFDANHENAYEAARELFVDLMSANGINLSDDAVDDFIAKTERWTRDTSVAGDFRRQFALTKEGGKPLGIVSAFILRLNGAVVDEASYDTGENTSYQYNNPLYTEATSMNVLTRLAVRFSQSLYSDTHKSSENKTIYDYGFNTILSSTFRQLKNDEAFRQDFEDVEIARNSFLLKHLNNDPALRAEMSISYLDGLKVAGKRKGTVRTAMSDREQLLTVIGLFQNRGNATKANYVSLTHADKSKTPIFMNMPRIANVRTTEVVGTGDSKSKRTTFAPEVMTAMFDVFYAEYDRIIRSKQVGSYNNKKYEAGSQYFYFLPQFNFEQIKSLVSPEKWSKIYEEDGSLRAKDAKGFKQVVQELLTQHMHDMKTRVVAEWRKNGITQPGTASRFDYRYGNRLLANIEVYVGQPTAEDHALAQAMGVKTPNEIYWTRSGQRFTAEELGTQIESLAAYDYAVNSFLMNVSMSQLIYGDPAQAWKGSVEETMVDYGKRLSKDIAPGREGAWGANATYTAVTLADFKTNATYLQEFKEITDAYNKKNPIEATDAQEFVTVQEHLDVLYAYGSITEKVYREMSKIIEDAVDGFYEFKKPHHLEVIMQPMKPVYVGNRKPVDGAILNDYIKSSAYPLYPPFTASKELDKLRRAMEKGKIARANFASAKKLGQPSKPVSLFSTDGTIDESIFETSDWKGTDKDDNPVPSALQVLDRKNFKIQQDIPYDAVKKSIRTVSQMNKLITESIAEIKTPFNFQGTEVSGETLAKYKDDIRKKLFALNRDRLYEEIGAELTDSGEVVFKDKKKLFAALEKRVLEDSTNFNANDLAYLRKSNRMENNDEELVIPLMFAPSASKFEIMLMSLVSEIANIQMPGKSYVQASTAGHQTVTKWEDLTAEQQKSIIRVGDYTGGPLKIVRHEDGTPRAAQVLLPFNFVVNGERVSVKKYVITNENGVRTLDTSKVPLELLQLVGARIPNQGHNSMLPIEVVGFVPDNMGDLMIVPAAITKQMGSDFDVDKLYAYRRPYKHRNGRFKVADGTPWVTPAETQTAAPLEQPDLSLSLIPTTALAQDIITKVRVADTGEEVETEVPAKQVHDHIKQELKTLKELLKCLQ